VIPAAELSTDEIKSEARRLGFSAVGVARVEEPGVAGDAAGADDVSGTAQRAAAAESHYRAWLARGDHGTMGYMARLVAERSHPRRLWPDARSLVAVAWNTWRSDEPAGGRAGFARYARGRDYHRAVGTRLRALGRFVEARHPGARVRAAVDTGPILERAWAETAGLGFVGKHAQVIAKECGNWAMLGTLLTDLALAPDAPAERRCGTCARCMTACPTGAIPEPYRVDARRCISYLTIEHRGAIPLELRPLVGGRVFGCDDCLDACPWNRFAKEAACDEVRARPGLLETPLEAWLALDEAAFRERFMGTAVLRARRGGFLRNVCIALGNAGRPQSVPALATALGDADPLVRAHAAWALGRIGGERARTALAARLEREDDVSVREEIAAACAPAEAAS
jgi:epoxyqueuosine reductase